MTRYRDFITGSQERAYVVLAGRRQDWAAGARSRPVHASMNYAIGVDMAGAEYSLWWTLRLAGAYALFRSSNYGDVPRPRNGRGRSRARSESANNSGKQRGTASDNSGVFRPKPRISAAERDISAVIFGKNSGNSENRRRPAAARPAGGPSHLGVGAVVPDVEDVFRVDDVAFLVPGQRADDGLRGHRMQCF